MQGESRCYSETLAPDNSSLAGAGPARSDQGKRAVLLLRRWEAYDGGWPRADYLIAPRRPKAAKGRVRAGRGHFGTYGTAHAALP
jgi:hypothetical protein